MVTPGSMSTTAEPTAERVERPARLPRWVGIVLPVAILGGLGLVALQSVNRSWLPIVVLLGGSAGLGLLTGWAARRSLPHRSNLVRWLVAMGALTIGLLAAGIVSGGETGLGPLLPLSPRLRWVEVLQLISAGVAAWLAVRAFARPAVPAPDPLPDPDPTAWGFTYHPSIHDTQPIRARRGRRSPVVPTRRPSTPAATGVAAAAVRAPDLRPSTARRAGPLRQGYDRLRARLERAATWRPTLGLLPSQRRSSPIRFTGAGEDRCPYCLDIVAENDRRGVTTCPVCHTRHHAECWAVTGTCQMPHLYQGNHVSRTGAAR
jgi:hypothetical protein